jgi:quercetin dioxygenase-like cupin family protein
VTGRGLALWAALLLLPSPAAAAGGGGLDSVVKRAIRRNYEALHGCYRKVLAEDRTRQGTVFVRATLGPRDAVVSAQVDRDELNNKQALACILGWIGGWTLDGAAAAGVGSGSEVVIPLTFRAAPGQFVVDRQDVVHRSLGGKSTARVMLHAGSVGARKASLALLSINSPVLLPGKAGVDQALYVLWGKGRLEAGRSQSLRTGSAVWIPPGARARLSGKLELLQVLAPAGLEQATRKGKLVPATGAGRALVVRAARVRPLRFRHKKLTITPLLHSGTLKHRRLYLGLLKAGSGSGAASHDHGSQAELVYLISGRARVTLGKQTREVTQGQALYLPAGAPHAFTVLEPLEAVQIYAPAGPEQRFFKAAGRNKGRRKKK